jgi:hypothetical protein
MARDKVEKRFYRGKLPTIVWDAKNNRALCDFSMGHYTTSDPREIEILEKIGYMEVPIDATYPPEIREPIQPAEMPDIKALPKGMTEKGAAEVQREKALREKEDDDGPSVPVPKKSTTAKPKNSPQKEKRSIKRRGK